MAATKTMFMHFIDGGTTMSHPISNHKDSNTKFALVQSIVSSFTLQRMMASKTVECGVLCANGDDSIKECVELRRPSIDSLKLIQDIEQEGKEGANLLGGLNEAHEVLMTTNQGKKFNRVLIIYTDGESSLSSNASELKSLQRDLMNDDVLVYLLVLCDQSRDDLDSAVTDHITQCQEFIDGVGGSMSVVHELQSALKFLSSGPGLGSRPMQSKILFEISPTLKLSCVYCTKTMKAPLPSLKKQSNLSYDEDIPDSGKVSTNYSYRNPSDPDEELEFEERVKGYRYGPQYIPMAGMEENLLKLVSEPVLRLLGCVPASTIARHHFLSSSFILGVAAGESNDGTRRAIGALSQALQRLQQAALCRLVKRANSDPWLVVLLPNPDGTLLMHRLPCSEDIRHFMFPPLTSMASVAPLQQQAVAAAVDSMTVSSLRSEDLLMVNPAYMAFLSQLQENAGSITAPLAGIQNYDNTFKSLGDQPSSAKVWAEVKASFHLEPTDQSSRDKKKRKKYWSDFNIDSGGGADIKPSVEGVVGDSQKQARLDSEHAVPSVLNEGSVNPVEDLEQVIAVFKTAKEGNASNLAAIEDAVITSLHTMEKIIDLLVTTGGTNAHYRKAVNCLQSYRHACLVDFGDSSVTVVVERYNEFLMTGVKEKFKGGRHNAFWSSVVTAGVSLVHDGESKGSRVTAEQSTQFLLEAVAPVVEVVPEVKAEEVEEDDMWGDMA